MLKIFEELLSVLLINSKLSTFDWINESTMRNFGSFSCPPFSFIEFVVCCVWGGMDAEALRAKLDVIPAFVGPRGCRGSWTEDTQNCWALGTVPSDALTSEQP